jgi:ABC-2 type transport system ATP-binding protein
MTAPPVPASEIRGLTQRFGQGVAVEAMDLSVTAGECFGLLGPYGAGRTKTIRLLVTLLPLGRLAR